LSPNANAYPSIRPFCSGHVITQSRKISANSPLAKRKQTDDREPLCRIFLKKPSFSRTDFFTKLGPQIRLLLLREAANAHAEVAAAREATLQAQNGAAQEIQHVKETMARQAQKEEAALKKKLEVAEQKAKDAAADLQDVIEGKLPSSPQADSAYFVCSYC
jgi:hypothetical protein